MVIQKSMEDYLEDKYDKEFVIGKPKLTDSGLARPGLYRAEAYPEDNPTLKFEVGKHQDQDKFFDYYTGAIWAREETPRIENLLRTLYPSGIPEFRLRTHIATNAEPDPIYGAVPSIVDAIEEYNDDFYYYLSIKYSVSVLDDSIKSQIRSSFTEINDFIKNRGVSNPSLYYLISVEDEDAGYRCSTADLDRLGSIDAVLDNCLRKPDKKGTY